MRIYHVLNRTPNSKFTWIDFFMVLHVRINLDPPENTALHFICAGPFKEIFKCPAQDEFPS